MSLAGLAPTTDDMNEMKEGNSGASAGMAFSVPPVKADSDGRLGVVTAGRSVFSPHPILGILILEPPLSLATLSKTVRHPVWQKSCA